VIGRLVKQQQIGTAGQGTGEIQPNPPATGKIRHRPREVGIAESQPVQHLSGARLGGVTIDIGIAGVQAANGFTVAARFRSRNSLSTRRNSLSPSSTNSSAGVGSAGVSWATRAICQLAGNSRSPASACNSPATKANRLDFPLPLAPTTPTFQPV